MSYTSVAQTIVDHATVGGQGRVLSLDLETKALGNDFLTGETILSASAAWREYGTVRGGVLVLGDESEAAEWKLLGELDNLLLRQRPLVVVGYCITRYDLPLLGIKMRRTPRPFWGLEDTISRAFFLDLKDPVRFELANYNRCSPKIQSLDKVVQHGRFSHLPLMRTKNILSCQDKTEKGRAIYELWKDKPDLFRQYSLGDAHDALLIFEDLFLKPKIEAPVP